MKNNGDLKPRSNSEKLLEMEICQSQDLQEFAIQIQEEKPEFIEKLEKTLSSGESKNENNLKVLQEFNFLQNQSFLTQEQELKENKVRRRSNSRQLVESDFNNNENVLSSKSQSFQKSDQVIIIGICAREKKTQCKPMKNILKHLEFFRQFQLIVFTDDQILNQDVTIWPVVQVLIAFYSEGFPLDKVQSYCELNNPFLINDIQKQNFLLNRGTVYQMMKVNEIPVLDFYISDQSLIQEHENFIIINGFKLIKPFVEKPMDAERHDVFIYYHSDQGGGRTEMFRKVDDRSSQFSQVSTIRRDGLYLYEKFLPTQGFDIKIYTVCSEYAHAETRKAPYLDGKVNRTAEGKEFRMPIQLSKDEKAIAKKIVEVFGQNVCGFDILRSNGKVYVCDINGWSFVKDSPKYWSDCSLILASYIFENVWKDIEVSIPRYFEEKEIVIKNTKDKEQQNKKEQLRALVAVFRHGDRTPKQKIKIEVNHPLILTFFNENCINAKKELKIKAAKHMQQVLDVVGQIIGELTADPQYETALEKKNLHFLQKMKIIKKVLEKGGHFLGINRKIQMKPIKEDNGLCIELLFIMKWGGVLTHSGEEQAYQLGQEFRQTMYPGEGLIRLHNTYRHDLKTYSSDEGRCQKTAAAFLKGFLSLEGTLGPILISLINSRCKELLDDASEAKDAMDTMKQKLFNYLNTSQELIDTFHEEIPEFQLIPLIKDIGNPVTLMEETLQLIKQLVKDLKNQQNQVEQENLACGEEPLSIIQKRWKKLMKDFKHENKFDISKILNIHDMIEYDIMHNRKVMPGYTGSLFHDIHKLANFVTPLEYGMNIKQKLIISFKIVQNLIQKIKHDLVWWITQEIKEVFSPNFQGENNKEEKEFNWSKAKAMKNTDKHVRTRLYFTSASHMYSLFNIIKYGVFHKVLIGHEKQLEEKFTLDYLSYFVLRMYENQNVTPDDQNRFRIELSLSHGAQTEFLQEETHICPVEPFITLSNYATLQQVLNCFGSINSINTEEPFSPQVLPIFF